MSQAPVGRLTPEEEYQRIFEAASDGLVIYDVELDLIVEANPAACEMHGYTREEFIGLNAGAFMSPDSQVRFREHARMAESGRVFESPVVHIRKDGSSFYVEVHRSAINYAGRPCLLSAIRDVSERIQQE